MSLSHEDPRSRTDAVPDLSNETIEYYIQRGRQLQSQMISSAIADGYRAVKRGLLRLLAPNSGNGALAGDALGNPRPGRG
tara:strand:- start:157 stop:396 length:240 start_codon:yes stop_codon:yes gene_type:complete